MNKLLGLFLLALAFLAPSVANAASCFWVGGTGSINDTTHWSNATGGTISTCTAAGGWPNSTSDTATFDASSGGGTITRNVNWTIGTLTTSLFTGTFGNSTDSATVNFNNWSNNGSGIRTVNLGTSTWTCGASGTTACNGWGFTGATNLTFNANTSTVVLGGSTASGVQVANLGVFTYNVVTFGPESSSSNEGTSWNSSGTTTIATLNLGSPNFFYMNNANVLAVTNLNFTGGTPSLSSWTSFVSSSIGNQWQMTLTNAASCQFCIWRDSKINTSTITSTNSVDQGHNTGITISAPTGGGGGGGRIIGG